MTDLTISRLTEIIDDIVLTREDQGDSPLFENPKEAMLLLHTCWQSFLSTIKEQKDIEGRGAAYALRLAATAIKFAEDYGNKSVDKYIVS